MSIATLEHQPDFPAVDLSENNALFFELLLTSRAQVEQHHRSAEAAELLYKLGHASVRLSADTFANESGYESLQYGLAGYEIIASIIVTPREPLADIVPHVAARSLITTLHKSTAPDFMQDLYDEFTHEQPITTQVIRAAASQHHAATAHYAVIGAAIGRQLDLDAREFDPNTVQ